jgi:hypothetical protein
MRLVLVGLLSLLSVACIDFGDSDGHVPGEALGEYHVAAALESSTCGADALGTPEQWEFDIRLSRDRADLFWLNGAEVIPGRVGPDGVSFEFDTAVAVPITPPEGTRPGCTVMRSDRATGELSGSDADVTGFDGTLVYGYAPDDGSDCSSLVGVPGGFAMLPCEIAFLLEATRTSAPGDSG